MKKSFFLVAATCFFFVTFITVLSANEPATEKVTNVQETAEVNKPATVSVVESVICRNIVNRNPSEPGETFEKETGRLYCFTRMASDAKTEVKHIWYRNDIEVADISLSIGASSGWRTFSSKNIRPIDTGKWKVDIVDASDKVLSSNSFIISE